MSESGRVAVIVVHGIADQRAGQSVRQVVRLLCHGADGEPRYVRGEMHEILVPVKKLEPGSGRKSSPGETTRVDRPTRTPGSPSGFYLAQKIGDFEPSPSGGTVDLQSFSAGPQAAQSQDLGIALNDYLLEQHVHSHQDALYESTRASLRRRVDDRPVDVYELHWADLSRLGSSWLQALAAVYQLFFHLSTLASDVVDQVVLGAGGGRGWRFLQRLHAWMAWLMKGPLAMLQVSMLLIVLFGMSVRVPPERQGVLIATVFGITGVILFAMAGVTFLRASAPIDRWGKLSGLFIASIICLQIAATSVSSLHWVHLIHFGASALVAGMVAVGVIELYARVATGIRVFGYVLIMTTIVVLCFNGWTLLPQVTTQIEWTVTAALNTAEWLLAGMLLVWALFVVLQSAALLLGLWLGRTRDTPGKASLHTARMLLVSSTGLFALISLLIWSGVASEVGDSLKEGGVLTELLYEPVVFGEGYRSASIFLEYRMESIGQLFSPLLYFSALFAAAGLLVILPALLEEFFPSRGINKQALDGGDVQSARLGVWLGMGMHSLRKASMFIVPPAALIGGALYVAGVLDVFSAEFQGSPLAAMLSKYLPLFQGTGRWVAGGAILVAILGLRFTRVFGPFRVALDAVLDVDNYFVDPPNGQQPRARIFSRYASLLAYLRDGGYKRIVIVSHSQGTVISAELLRYLHVKGRLSETTGGVPVSLLTLGSPLRDLYAQNFPLLYRWMGSNSEGFETASPDVSDIGVAEWVNACCSGDYVGRFIWSPAWERDRFHVARIAPDGSVMARRTQNRTEFCLGVGGHTRYFSDDSVALAIEIDRLIAGKK